MTAPDSELLDRARARLGTTLKGKYRLDKVLGVGGMATVFAATHRNGKEFAVKMLHAELSISADVRARFLREGYVANKVKHPGAVQVLDDDTDDDGGAFLVMELLEGQTCEDLWEQYGRKLPMETVLSIGHQLLGVLAAAHTASIVHRDIKPANLFLTKDGQLKVLDFGIARLRDVATSHATQTGMTMGTPAFMAPEQAMAKTSEIDGLTDVWSAGATLFTLASGRLIHEGENAQQLLVIAATTPARSLAEVLPEAHHEIVKVIDRSLAFHKSQRWASASEMRDALHDVYKTVFEGAPPSALLVTKPAMAAAVRTVPMQHAPGRASATPTPGSMRGGTQPLAPTPARALAAEARLPATEQPVERAAAGRTGSFLGTKRVPLMVGAAGVIAVAIAFVAVAALRSGKSEPHAVTGAASATATATATVAATAMASATATATATSEPSTVSIDSLPTAATAKPVATPVGGTATATVTATATAAVATAKPTAASTATAAKAGCSPPYTIDPATGKKKWKAECL